MINWTTGPEAAFIDFGHLIGRDTMTPVVLLLFRNATAQSSQNTSKCGINHFHRFARLYIGSKFHPLPHEEISFKGLLLSFFTATLFAHPREFQYSTIQNYVSHVRASWLAAGAPLLPFDAKIIRRLLSGVRILRPRRPDTRMAFLLPHLTPPPNFLTTPIHRPPAVQSCGHFWFFWHATLWFIG